MHEVTGHRNVIRPLSSLGECAEVLPREPCGLKLILRSKAKLPCVVLHVVMQRPAYHAGVG